MTNEQIKNVRSLVHHIGRIAAIKYLRASGLPFTVAKLAVLDITNGERWTKPEIKADLNRWDTSRDVAFN